MDRKDVANMKSGQLLTGPKGVDDPPSILKIDFIDCSFWVVGPYSVLRKYNLDKPSSEEERWFKDPYSAFRHWNEQVSSVMKTAVKGVFTNAQED